MRAAIIAIVVGWAAAAHAAPRRPPADPATTPSADDDWERATEAWRAAARAPSEDTWRAAAQAFDAVVIANRVDATVRLECAHAAALAWRESVAAEPPRIDRSPPHDGDLGRVPAPRAIDERLQPVLAAWSRYLELAPAAAPDATELRFLRGNVLRRFDHLDEAEADFAIVADDPAAGDLALYAANLWLDSLDRQQRYDELVALAQRLHDDAARMKRVPDLADTVARILSQARRLDAEHGERAAEQGDPDGFARCADAYAALYRDDPKADRADELLYDEASCAEKAGDPKRARDRLALLVAKLPRSPLAGKALVRGATIALDTGDVANAAPELERYARRYPGEKDAYAALANAASIRIALGELDAAERDVGALGKLPRPHWSDGGVEDARLALAHAWAQAGDRARARRAMPAEHDLREAETRFAAATLAWELACPVATTDDALFADAARGHLALHVAQVTRGPTDGARAAFEACRDHAIERMAPTPWLASCEAQLAALGAPPPPSPEHRSAPRSPIPAHDLAPPR